MHDDIIQHYLLLRCWLSLEFFIFSTLQKTYSVEVKKYLFVFTEMNI